MVPDQSSVIAERWHSDRAGASSLALCGGCCGGAASALTDLPGAANPAETEARLSWHPAVYSPGLWVGVSGRVARDRPVRPRARGVGRSSAREGRAGRQGLVG